MPLHTHTKQYAILSGEMFFEPLESGVYKGERYLGNCPSAELSIEPQKIDHYDADTNAVTKDASYATRVDRTMTLTLDDMSVENLALFYSAASSTVSQTTTPVVGYTISDVQQGRYYQIGANPTTNPTGVRNIGSVVVKVGATTKTITTDYLLDAVRGRLYIVPGGGIANLDDVLVDYTPVANSRTRLATGASVTVEGRMRFVANNLSGSNRDYYFPSVSITPSGAFQFKGGGENPAFATASFTVEILKPGTGEAIYIDGEPA